MRKPDGLHPPSVYFNLTEKRSDFDTHERGSRRRRRNCDGGAIAKGEALPRGLIQFQFAPAAILFAAYSI